MIRQVINKLALNAKAELINFGKAKTSEERDRAFHRYELLLTLIRKDIPDIYSRDKESFAKVSDDAIKVIDIMQTSAILDAKE